mmetsp:Transcript_26392/g.54421  ORF Transcript_26392/g.54421 Transcript_26392/m.54421 type:complete len:1166 (-) Transcript_26392:273-3770(-)|eukprot:CAMPEP_0201217538 /NCGR_PEP_ID=MMETSP0851-20130426/190110_1 /ASSEMBLY_ACC=CAM_ASM_000631 /TAXON_ID=183588 /ORGANISM="Pseudo-nitzschia fraudulenta, Strain WWA7" /LENGTH=1165 /DNA_ID=CAMNT_0047507191 /DNA_START=426 /DNA_END=3923 /DNA_ORIENTATION=-
MEENNADTDVVFSRNLDNPDEDSKTSDERQSIGTKGTPEAETKVVTGAEFNTFVASLDIANRVDSTGSDVLDLALMSSSSHESKKDEAIQTPKKTVKAHLSPRKKGQLFHSAHNKINNDVVFSPQGSSSLILSSLPIDSLHSIASFLTPIEWKRFGQGNKRTNKICREIFRRVRMHGFRCATEVITAWKLGQHEDAKELCALYVSAGVPIYPYSLGHSYRTLVWRLSIEAKHLREQQEQAKDGDNTEKKSSIDVNTHGEPISSNVPNVTDHPSNDGPTEVVTVVDPFYNEREQFRMREELLRDFCETDLTYLEEKSLFNLHAKGNESEVSRYWRQKLIDRAHRRARSYVSAGLPHPLALPQVPRMPLPLAPELSDTPLARTRLSPLAGTGHVTAHRRTRSYSFSGRRNRVPNVSLKIHRHLLDQHLLGRTGVNDGDGTMATPSVSLSADFFHPYFSFRPTEEAHQNQSNGAQNSGYSTAQTNGLLPAFHRYPTRYPLAPTPPTNDNNHETIGDPSMPRRTESISSNLGEDSDSDGETENIFPRPFITESPLLHNIDEMNAAGAPSELTTMSPSIPPVDPLDPNRRSIAGGIIPEIGTVPRHARAQNDILSNIDLNVYSASSKCLKTDNNDATGLQLSNYLKGRFTVYQCCLERHLSTNDNDGFEETIMDFWDEFLPQTANIQYWDMKTAVPRISRLEKFLTKPCPKAIGIVQCEIERVKSGSKKKGVNVKGRFFPTYEYRLFIRHRIDESTTDFIDAGSDFENRRRDTVLMMAKNRGRKHIENTGQAFKKGSNNYYLSLPEQDDLNLHHKSVNGLDGIQKNAPNGVGSRSRASEFSGLLGRLQSNFFVGTEFQIFTPRSITTTGQSLSPRSIVVPHSNNPGFTSDSDVFHDSRRQSEPNSISSPRPRSRFGRLSLRGRSDNNGDIGSDLSEPFQPKSSPLTLRRRSRSSDATPRRNRKVSAAESFFESQHRKAETERIFEEEDGAITYTANLLGSRPRIMDVCIPKVSPNGSGMEWKRCLESSKDQDAGSSAGHLLNHLKQLQQKGQMDEHGRLVDPANNDSEVLGTDEREDSLPSDFGLLALQNRPPWWNVELGSFVLNFGGRVSVASVKNFQLCDRNDQDHIMLQFGRIEGRHAFTMDFQYPLTAVQAFAISISSLQSKISFG